MITDEDARKIAKAVANERIRRKCLVNSWMDGTFSSEELHNLLREDNS